MPRFRSAPLSENFAPPGQRPPGRIGLAPAAAPFVRRVLPPESSRALEMLGHAIEYLADEYAVDTTDKGPLGSADPRVEAIQILKGLNRAVYFSGTEAPPAIDRVKRWFLGLLAT